MLSIIVSGLLVSVVTASAPPHSGEPVEIHVGVVAFEDFHKRSRLWEQFFAELSDKHDSAVRFRMAAGTYDDVLHWIRQGLVDVAILTPGAVSELLPSIRGPANTGSCQYVATVKLPAAKSKWALPDRRITGHQEWYRSVGVVSADSPVRSADDLRELAKTSAVQFLFVHPLSLSGNLAPRLALKGIGIELKQNQIDFTYSHSASLRALTSAADKQVRVAFVWDGALRDVAQPAEAFRTVTFPELDALKIPQDVIVARADFKHVGMLITMLAEYVPRNGQYAVARLEDWRQNYQIVRGWRASLGLPSRSRQTNRASLNEIGQILVHFARSQPKPPRLALVLTGGGAKCSFQVGAVAALEEHLAELREQHSQPGLEISLVVGTSGGAINAVPIALGITETEAGRRDFFDTWKALDQRKIVRPSRIVRVNIGLWFALFQTALALWLIRRITSQPRRRGWLLAWLMVVLASVEILLGYLPLSPWSWLGTDHTWHHLWLWCSFGIRASAWCLLVFGLLSLIGQFLLVRRGKCLTAPVRLVAWGLVIGLLGLPLVQVVTVLFYEDTLSGGGGMESALAEKFPQLINGHLRRRLKAPLTLEESSPAAQRVRSVSDQILRRRLLERDLVITGSCLAQSSETLPSDLYFYAAAGRQSAPPDFEAHGVLLAAHPEILLDIVLGSSSIFPVFPPRSVQDFPQSGDSVELVDGGFAHNSPIEAAVLWGATHVVLIEASPRQTTARNHFAQNVGAAFNHLYQQAQLLDARSRGQVTVFTLAPEPPHICVLDFADNLISDSISRGYRAARSELQVDGAAVSGPLRFRKELGEPVFTNVKAIH